MNKGFVAAGILVGTFLIHSSALCDPLLIKLVGKYDSSTNEISYEREVNIDDAASFPLKLPGAAKAKEITYDFVAPMIKGPINLNKLKDTDEENATRNKVDQLLDKGTKLFHEFITAVTSCVRNGSGSSSDESAIFCGGERGDKVHDKIVEMKDFDAKVAGMAAKDPKLKQVGLAKNLFKSVDGATLAGNPLLDQLGINKIECSDSTDKISSRCELSLNKVVAQDASSKKGSPTGASFDGSPQSDNEAEVKSAASASATMGRRHEASKASVNGARTH